MVSEGQQQFKRNIAYKIKIGDLMLGKPVFDNEKFIFLELGDRKIVRVNLIGNIVDRYEREGETKYIFLSLDDGSGQIRLTIFGDDVEKFKNFSQGQTIVVIGVLRSFNNEINIRPEIIKEVDTRYLLVRKLELGKEGNNGIQKVPREHIIAVKDKILEKIKNSETSGGIEIENIVMEIREAPSDIINQEIKKLLEEGIIFEPRPGRLRYLG